MKQSSPNKVEPLVELLRDNHSKVREQAVSSLLQMSWRPTSAEDNAYFLLAQILLDLSKKGRVTIFKAKKLRALGVQAVDPLIRSLSLEGTSYYKEFNYSKGEMQNWIPSKNVVLQCLLDIGPLAIPALEKALDDPDPIIRQMAEETLKKIPRKKEPKIFPATSNSTKKRMPKIMVALIIIGLFLCVCIIPVMVYLLSGYM